MIDAIVHLKNGEKLEFTINARMEELNAKLNKLKFIKLGPVCLNISEIMYIEGR